MRWKRASLIAATAILGAAGPARLVAQDGSELSDQDLNLRAYIELLRSDLKTQKMAVIADVMKLNEEDSAKFWPIYKQYQTELTQLGDQRLALIQKYTAQYDNLTDAEAHQLALAAFDLESKRTELKKKYYKRIESAVSAKTAARFFQVENQILMLLDLQVASLLPVVK